MIPSKTQSRTNARGLRRIRLLQAASEALSSRTRGRSVQHVRIRPRLEGLEDRSLLSVTFTPFPVSDPNAGVEWVTTGSDGNLWFTEQRVNKIGTINPTTHVISEFDIPTAGSGPREIVAGPDGNLWFTELGGGSIGMINPTTHAFSEFPLESGLGGTPSSITSGADGNIWFCFGGGDHIGSINPTTHEILYYAAPTSDVSIFGITAGPDGNIWFTEAADEGDQIGSINLATHVITEYDIPPSDTPSFPHAVAPGPDGNIWFTMNSEIGRFDLTTHAFKMFPVVSTANYLRSLTTGPDGNIWFSNGGGAANNSDDPGSIGMVDLSTQTLTEYPVTYEGSYPAGLTLGPDGNLWLADFSFTNAAVSLITLDEPAVEHLKISAQPPASVVAGSPFEFTVQAIDASGKLDTAFNGAVTVDLAHGPEGAALGGTLTVTASNGVAHFSGLTLTSAASNYRLSVSTSGLRSLNTDAFTVTPAAASQLVIHTQPSTTAIAGRFFATQPVVYLTDQFGNVETGDSTTVITASLVSGAGPLQGNTSVTVSGGIATFTNLADNKAETISLQFNGGGFTASPGGSIVVKPGLAARLVIQRQSSATATAGQAFATQPVVRLEDFYGNLETDDSSTVISASLFSGSGPLQGTTTATVSGGIATFTNLADNRAETISLRFNGAGLSSLASGSIDVQPAAASQLVVHTQPSSSALVTQTLKTQPVIHVEDAFGNLVTGLNGAVVTASLNSGAGPLLGTTSAVVSGGVATFANLAGSAAETITLRFESGSLTSAISAPVVVDPAVDLRISTLLILNPAIEVGSSITYPIFVTNNGPSPATNVTVAIEALGFLANLGTLAAGGSATATVAVTPSAVGTLTNVVTVTSNETDLDPSSNTMTFSTTVLDRLGTIQLGSTRYNVPENAGSAAIVVNRVNGSRGTVTVDYQASPINAKPGLDFTPISGTLTFADGVTSQTIVVPVLANPYGQQDALVSVVLSNVRSTEMLGQARLGTANEATLAIQNTDSSLSSLTVSRVQWTGTAQNITQILVSFSHAVTSSSATNPANYTLVDVGRDGRPGTSDDTNVAVAVAMSQSSPSIVALTPVQSLQAGRFYRLGISGGASGGITDPGENLLAGDGVVAGTSYTAMLARGTNLKYFTPTGDQVTLKITGGGIIDDLLTGTGQGRWLSVTGAVPHRTVLSGSVRKIRGGTGRAYLGDTISGLGQFGDVRVKLSTPPFQIGQYPFASGTASANSARSMIRPFRKLGR